MWIPRSWSDIALSIGALSENEFLDFKREMAPPKELRDIAKDAAAMSLQGGVIVIGVDEEDELASEITPVPLQGAVERIRQVIDARVTPSLALEITTLTEQPGAEEGVIVVSVAPSWSAPHQYDHRFPARSGPTTRWLTETELDTLFARRSALKVEAGTGGMAGHEYPPGLRLELDEMVGLLLVRLRPMVELRHPDEPRMRRALTQATVGAQGNTSELFGRFSPKALDFLENWEPSGQYGWRSGYFNATASQLGGSGIVGGVYRYGHGFSYTVQISLQSGHEPDAPEGAKSAQEHHWGIETMALLACGGEFYTTIPGASLLRVDLELGGLLDTVSYQASGGLVFDSNAPRVTENPYNAGGIFSASELASDPRDATRQLLDPFMVSILEEGVDIVDWIGT